jgi:hypothetical protein
MKKKYALWLLFCTFACTKEIQIDIPAQKPSLVVYSTLVPFSFTNSRQLELSLQSSLHIFDTTPQRINDALVLYFENNVVKDTLIYSDLSQTYMVTRKIPDFPVTGNHYSILIKKDGYESVFAETVIPRQVKIRDVIVTPVAYFDENRQVHSEIAMTFEDPADAINFYEVAVTDIAFSEDSPDTFHELMTNDKLVTSESYYPSLMQLDVRKPKYLLFSDAAINGKSHTLLMYYFPNQRFNGRLYISTHYISVHLRNVTEEYFKYKTTLIQHLNSKMEDFLYGTGESVNTISNIQNGYGLFAGYNTDILSKRIDSLIVRIP